VLLREVNWLGDVAPGPCEARFRYRQPLLQAELVVTGPEARVRIHVPRHIPLGQSLVLYSGDRCLGGGTVAQTTLQ
jgi:tRNA-specific 2-thiouridylase